MGAILAVGIALAQAGTIGAYAGLALALVVVGAMLVAIARR